MSTDNFKNIDLRRKYQGNKGLCHSYMDAKKLLEIIKYDSTKDTYDSKTE